MSTKLESLPTQIGMGFLKDLKIRPKKSEIFRFVRARDRIFGRYISRRTAKTTFNDAARVLDADIIESIVADKAGVDGFGTIGAHSIFESTGMTAALDAAQLRPGDHFVLQLLWIAEKSRFKKFGCVKVPADFNGER